MEWVEELIEVGIEDVHRLDLLVPPEDVDAAIARMLPELKPQTAQANLTIQEESDLVPTLMLFGTPSLVSKHRADLQIYTEACKAFSKLNISNLLVTGYILNLQQVIAEATSTMQRMYGPIFLMCGCAMCSIL